MPRLPIPRHLLSPRNLLPFAVLSAVLIPFTLALWWTNGIPSTSITLPSSWIGPGSQAKVKAQAVPIATLETLGYTGAPDAADRYPANVRPPERIEELRGAPWAGGWGVPGINPGLDCKGHGRYAVAEESGYDETTSSGQDGVGVDVDDDSSTEEEDALFEVQLDDGRQAGSNESDDFETTTDERSLIEPTLHPTDLRSKRWRGSLSPSSSGPSPPHAAFLLLHFFSTPSHKPAARARRDLIRRTIFTSIPRPLRRFIDVKFVLAHAWDPALSQVIDKEEALYRDLVRLGVPDPKDEGGRGLGVRWLDWLSEKTEEVGGGRMEEAGQREGVWVVKCSDDVLPILPNLLPYLLAQNPSVPTYFGTSLYTEIKAPPYFERHMFGFTWGVVKTIAAAGLSDGVKDRVGDIGLSFGELMYNLPSQPHHLSHTTRSNSSRPTERQIPPDPADPLFPSGPGPGPEPEPEFISHAPPSPDPRTGLIYLDAGNLIAPFSSPYAAQGHEALAWYEIGDDFAYELDALGKAIKDVREEGRRYKWLEPPAMREIVEACELLGR